MLFCFYVLMNTMFRTHTCGELTIKDKGKKVKLAGWVNSRRDHGGLIFLDLRDKYGITQCTFNPKNKEAFQMGDKVRPEFVVLIEGKITSRPAEMVNKKIKTGEIEILIDKLDIFSKSKVPPFEISDRIKAGEEIRLKYRFLDLRRKKLQENIIFRSNLIKFIRDFLHKKEFTEIETPILTVSSPEGSRDYLVPSRLHPGKFYALPQAPQQFKQLLMIGGVDKYFQIAPCMRDEDPRADRAAGEFYQLDVETSFLQKEEFFKLMEPLFVEVSKKFSNKKILKKPFPQISYKESMERFGTDKPDLRFGYEICDLTSIVKNSNFEVFKKAEKVKGIYIEGGAAWSRKEIDELTEFAKKIGAGGLAWIKLTDKGFESSIAKFFPNGILLSIKDKFKAKKGSIFLFIADKEINALKILGEIRLHVAEKMGKRDKNILAWTWIVDFPMYEWKEEEGKLDFGHNPFSMPRGGIKALSEQKPLKIISEQYDIVCNGIEISSGAVRNHDPESLIRAFEIVGYKRTEVEKKFSAMINALRFGAPPHCGFAPGIERLLMILRDEKNIKEVIAFPKTGKGEDLLMGAPGEVTEKQLKELRIRLV
jgi:aspartyl-tRNA synthetase